MKFGDSTIPDLKKSKFWTQTEDELKLICNLGNDVYIYHIESMPMPRRKRSVDDTSILGKNIGVFPFLYYFRYELLLLKL